MNKTIADEDELYEEIKREIKRIKQGPANFFLLRTRWKIREALQDILSQMLHFAIFGC